MKKLIRKILREQEQEIITAPSFAFFNYKWNDVLDWADDKLFRINGNIALPQSDIITLGGLVEIDGYLNLWRCQNLKSLGELRSVNGHFNLRSCKNLESLGNLSSVGGNLNLFNCTNLQSLGELRSVGGWLDLRYTKIVEIITDKEIRSQVDIKGRIIR